MYSGICIRCNALWTGSKNKKYCTYECYRRAWHELFKIENTESYDTGFRNKRKMDGLCTQCGVVSVVDTRMCRTCRDKVNRDRNARNKKLRLDTINSYGGKCFCCSES